METAKKLPEITTVINRIKSNPSLKEFTHRLLIPKNQARPRWWVKTFLNPLVHKTGRHSLIRKNVRLDLLPFRSFSMGDHSTIEDFSVINNGMGPVTIGNHVRIGIANVLIGPIQIGNYVIFAQNIVVSGLNHGYQDISVPICKQQCTTGEIIIEDEVWIGANAVITAGITIGKHSVVAAGSVVTKSVPSYSIVAGNPARIIKQYNPESGNWEKIKEEDLLKKVS